MAQKSNYTVADALKLVGGGVVGAALALLAPQAGRKTRKDIVRYAKTIRGKSTPDLAQEKEKGATFYFIM